MIKLRYFFQDKSLAHCYKCGCTSRSRAFQPEFKQGLRQAHPVINVCFFGRKPYYQTFSVLTTSLEGF